MSKKTKTNQRRVSPLLLSDPMASEGAAGQIAVVTLELYIVSGLLMTPLNWQEQR